jgi:PAS domain-containing protein
MELSEQVFKVIFDNFNGIVIVHNYEGEILLLNDAARKKLFSKSRNCKEISSASAGL